METECSCAANFQQAADLHGPATHHQADQEQNQEDEEQDLGDANRRAGDTAKAEQRRQNRDH